MKFDIITIFPGIFESYFNESILKRAQKKSLIRISVHNLRDYTTDKHHKVDDSPYGGGPGMVLQIGPIYRAVRFAKSKISAKGGSLPAVATALQAGASGGKNQKSKIRSRVILFSTRGKKFDSKVAKRLSKYDQLILICGRYEGVDERVAKYIADEEISIGDYILSGGELPAMVLVEAVSRHIPGVLGKRESLEEIKGSYPAYTRPEVFVAKGKRERGKGKELWKVPKVLLSGAHKKIAEWRKEYKQKYNK